MESFHRSKSAPRSRSTFSYTHQQRRFSVRQRLRVPRDTCHTILMDDDLDRDRARYCFQPEHHRDVILALYYTQLLYSRNLTLMRHRLTQGWFCRTLVEHWLTTCQYWPYVMLIARAVSSDPPGTTNPTQDADGLGLSSSNSIDQSHRPGPRAHYPAYQQRCFGVRPASLITRDMCHTTPMDDDRCRDSARYSFQTESQRDVGAA